MAVGESLRAVLLLSIILSPLAAPAPCAAADAKPDGIEASITDTYGFTMRLANLAFKIKADPASGKEPVSLDHIPLTANGKPVSLWLAQISTAELAPATAAGQAEVKAVLQGQGDQVAGILENVSRCLFEGEIAEGARKGHAARFPLAEVKLLKVLTKYEGPVAGKGEIIPMPAPGQDLFWVSSVPLGAEVFAKPIEGKEMAIWKDYKRLGPAPLAQKLPPGKYAVRVLVPAKLAATLRPSTKLGEDTNPFEPDGWGELNFSQAANVVESMTYTVVKKDGQPATLIALFQKKDLSAAEILDLFPAGVNFQFSDKKLEGELLFRKVNVPKTDLPQILEALHRGGKVIWHGAEQSLMIELQPGERGWQITEAIRPKAKK